MTTHTPEAPKLYIRGAWTAAWTIADGTDAGGTPRIDVDQLVRTVAPTLSSAQLRYDYGRLYRVAEGAWSDVAPWSDASDQWFVRIDDPDDNCLWLGVIVSDDDAPDDDDLTDAAETQLPSGVQMLTAYGLEYLLTRVSVDRSFVDDAGSATEISSVLPFNLARPDGSIVGNRSSAKITTAGVGTSYLFADGEGDTWSTEDIIEYLIIRLVGDDVLAWTWDLPSHLSGDARAVAPGPTVYDTLNDLLDRRRGHCWTVRAATHATLGTLEPVLRVNSVLRSAVTVGATTIAASDDTATLNADGGADVESVRVRKSHASNIDRVTARGGPIVVCGSLDVEATGLVKAWTAAQESDYLAASDAGRAADEYRNVFTALRVASDWSGACHDGANGSPEAEDDGTLDTATSTYIYRQGRSFLRRLPLQEGVDYTTATPGTLDADAPVDFLAPMVFAAVGSLKARLDKLDAEALALEGLRPLAVSMLDGELGLRIHAQPNHVLAAGHWSGAADTDDPPLLDYTSLRATLAWRTDQVLHVTSTASSPASPARELTIDVPDCEQWYLVPGTVVGIDDSGAYRTAAGGLIRDDSDRLEAVAALAAAWYSLPRSAVTVRYRTTYYGIDAATLITDLTASGRTIAANSVVTRVTLDFLSSSTVVETGYAELDAVAMTSRGRAAVAALGPRGLSPVAAGRVAADETASLSASRAHLPISTPDNAPPEMFWAEIGSSADADSPAQNRWKYAWTEVVKSSAAYGGWAARSNGRSGTTSSNPAYNAMEDANSGAGTEMNGVDVDGTDFPSTFSLQPIPSGAIVLMRAAPGVSGGLEYWFAMPNGIDGTCE